MTGSALNKVAIATTGTFRQGTPDEATYTRADLEAMVANFDRNRPRFSVAAVLGHEENQPIRLATVFDVGGDPAAIDPTLANTGNPPHGWVSRLEADGDFLFAWFESVTDELRELIERDRCRYVSSEIYDRPPEGLAGSGCMLRRVAFLGATPPEQKRLPRLDPNSFSASAHSELRPASGYRSPDGYYVAFAERFGTMTEKRKFGKPAKFSDCAAKTVKAFDEMPADTPADAVAPAGVSKDDMVSTLAEYGFSAETMGKLDEATLGEILRGVMAMANSEPDDDGGETAAEADGNVKEFGGSEELRGKNQKPVKGGGRAQKTQLGAIWDEDPDGDYYPGNDDKNSEKYSESRTVKAARAEVDREVARLREVAAKAKREAEAVEVRTFCEEYRRRGVVLPANFDRVQARLLRADNARKYAEHGGKTERELQMDEIRNTPPVVAFSERFGQPKVDHDVEVSKVRRFAEQRGSELRAVGGPEKFVADFVEMRKKRPQLTAAEYGVRETV